MNKKSLFQKAGVLLVGLAAVPAFATTVYDPLVAGVDFTDVVTSVLAVAVLVVSVLVVMRGVRFIYAIVKR